MRVTVTGGTGFLGSYLVRDLLAKGVSVRVLARPSVRAKHLAAAGVEIVHGDLRDASSIARAVQGADVVYHLAAKVGSAPRKDYFQINVGGTQRVIQKCAENGVGQFVYASSLAVYGPMKEGTRIDESTAFDDKPQLRDPYSESKIRADEVVSAFAKKSGLPTVILREGIIFGPGRQLPAGLFAFRLGTTDVVFGKPQNRLPLNYVENLIDSMQVAATTRPGLREYNVLDDDALTLGRYHELKRATDHSRTHFASGWPLYVASPFAEILRPFIPMGDTRLSTHQLRRALQDRCYDTSKIRRDLGWSPRISVEEAIRKTMTEARPFTSSEIAVQQR
jgi:nucleoside-diphosphate-sugar epimerase